MARTGRFGRLPRSAPNLTSTIVALIQEAAAQEDENLIKAWNEGGDIDGVKVTDQMLLKHITSRRDQLSKTDPLYDYWDNLLNTYSFAIAESKMTLKYAQGAVSDGAMGNFYTTWAKKLPRESEAYRDLMRSAAQFLDAAKTGGGGGGGGSSGGRGGGGGGGAGSDISQDEYDARWNAALDREANYDISTSILLEAAYRENILLVRDRESGPDDLSRLRTGDEADHYQFMHLFDLLNEATPGDGRLGDLKQVLIENGITSLQYGQWVEWGEAKGEGLRARYEAAVAAGDTKTVINGLEDDMEQHRLQQSANRDIDEYAIYQEARANLEFDLQRAGLNPFEEADLLAKHRRLLDTLYDRASDSETMGFLRGEMNAFDDPDRLGTGPTLREGTEGGIRGVEDDAGFLGMAAAEVNERVRQIVSGESYMWLTQDENGFEAIDVIDRNDSALTDPLLGTVTMAPTSRGAPPAPMFIEYHDIEARAGTNPDPLSGLPTQPIPSMTGSPAIGKYFVLNGVTYYGVYTGGEAGDMKWFAGDSPFTTPRNRINIDPQTGTMVLEHMVTGGESYDPTSLMSEGAANEPTDRRLTRNEIMQLAFNPRSVISPMALNDDVPRARAFDDVSEAIVLSDPQMGRALLAANKGQVWELAQTLSPEDPDTAYADLNGARDKAVQVHNMGVTLARMEAAKFGIDPIEQAGFLARRTGGMVIDPETGEVTRLTPPQIEQSLGERPLSEEESREAAGLRVQETADENKRKRRMAQSATFDALRPHMTNSEVQSYLMTGRIPDSVYQRRPDLVPAKVMAPSRGGGMMGAPEWATRGPAEGPPIPASLKLPNMGQVARQQQQTRGAQPIDDIPRKKVTPHLRPNRPPPAAIVDRRTQQPIRNRPEPRTLGEYKVASGVTRPTSPRPIDERPKVRTPPKPKKPTFGRRTGARSGYRQT